MSFAPADLGDSVRIHAVRVKRLPNKACAAVLLGLALSIATSVGWAQEPAPAVPAPLAQAVPIKTAPAKPAGNRIDASLLGTWRVSRGVRAPWVPATDKAGDTKSWVGQTIRFGPDRVAGPESFKCTGVVNYEATRYGADALFQGGLPTPAARTDGAVKDLGFVAMPAIGTSLHCDAGLFEFHQVDADTELVAINNVIWTLDRSPGTLAGATSPAGVVQRLLEAHFAGDMSFNAQTLAAKRKFMSTSVLALTKRYFAKPINKDEVPDIDGDPLTDSQEYPTRFSVGVAARTGKRATVPVRFSDAYRIKTVTFVLTREVGAWKVDDVHYKDMPAFRQLLTGKVPK